MSSRKRNPGCGCCGIEDCGECCSDGEPMSIEVTVPSGEFSNAPGHCTNCGDLNGSTYILTGGFGEFRCPSQVADCNYQYLETDFCTNGGIANSDVLRVKGRIEHNETGSQCRVVIEFDIANTESGLRRDQHVYISAWENAPFTCDLKQVTCNWDSECHEFDPNLTCNSAKTSVTVDLS